MFDPLYANGTVSAGCWDKAEWEEGGGGERESYGCADRTFGGFILVRGTLLDGRFVKRKRAKKTKNAPKTLSGLRKCFEYILVPHFGNSPILGTCVVSALQWTGT